MWLFVFVCVCEKDILFVTYTKSIPLICALYCADVVLCCAVCAPCHFLSETNGISPKQMRATQTMEKHWFGHNKHQAATAAAANVYFSMERLYLYLYPFYIHNFLHSTPYLNKSYTFRLHFTLNIQSTQHFCESDTMWLWFHLCASPM